MCVFLFFFGGGGGVYIKYDDFSKELSFPPPSPPTHGDSIINLALIGTVTSVQKLFDNVDNDGLMMDANAISSTMSR